MKDKLKESNQWKVPLGFEGRCGENGKDIEGIIVSGGINNPFAFSTFVGYQNHLYKTGVAVLSYLQPAIIIIIVAHDNDPLYISIIV